MKILPIAILLLASCSVAPRAPEPYEQRKQQAALDEESENYARLHDQVKFWRESDRWWEKR